jgi:hypothetical protein
MNPWYIILVIFVASYYLLVYKGRSFFHRLDYRLRFVVAFIGFLLFWFTIFYPTIIPWMNSMNMYPLMAMLLYEGLFYLTMWTLTAALLGEDQHSRSLKISFVMFALYHALDAVEPPFIVNPNGVVDSLSQTAIISWDYAFGYTFHQIFGWSWNFLYYFTNIFVVGMLILIIIKITKPQLLGKLTRRVLE